MDIHDYRLRSGLAYGTLAQILVHIYETGEQTKVYTYEIYESCFFLFYLKIL